MTNQEKPCYICLKKGEWSLISKLGDTWVNPDGSFHSHTRKCDYCPRLIMPGRRPNQFVNEDDREIHRCEGYRQAKGFKAKLEISLDSFSGSGAVQFGISQA